MPLCAQVSEIRDRAGEGIKVQPDLPFLSGDKKLVADLNYSCSNEFSDGVSLAFYKYDSKGDSLLICRRLAQPVAFQSGAHAQTISFVAKDPKGSYIHPTFEAILKETGNLPAGQYKAFLQLQSAGIASSAARTYSYEVDSALSATSPLRKSLSDAMVPGAASGISNLTSAAKAIERNVHKIERLYNAKGLTPQITQSGGKQIVNLYYQDWFVGRYELEGSKSIASQIAGQKAQLSGNLSASANSELTGYRSLISQVRDLNKQKKEDKELTGQIGVSGNWSSGQPEYSTQDLNFYELRANLETEVMDIPVNVEAYYTTQDAHRSIKSSYARVHYDAEKAKAELLKLIGGFKSQYSNTAAKGKGLEQVYGSYLANLKDSKGALLNDLKKESGVTSLDGGSINSDALKAQIKTALEAKMAAADNADSSTSKDGKEAVAKAQAAQARAKMIEDSATHIYERTMKRYEQMQALEKKIEKYQSLITQYQSTSYFDSALAYSKVAGIEHPDEATYKQLAKKAGGLLPEGKAKSFIAGLTSLDAGIFPKYVSKYTMAGQQLKGLDAGYDIGFAQIGITAGKTEYAGRDGTLDKYTTYGARALFTPLKEQKVGLIYYGYTPSKSAFSSYGDFYKNIDIALPTFRSPVHIVSATYEGTIAKNVHIESEAATSFKNGSSQTFATGFDADRLAYHATAEGQIPKTGLVLTGSYEHGGKDFQNSTLPVIISGTDLYKGAVKGDFFKGFLTAGVEYNHMQQSSFYSTGGNSRWGFDIATHSKQYPSIALSYKPFATFRAQTTTDTFNIPQRPLVGAVWSGRANYQIKHSGGRVWRFSAVYNKSISKTDSVSYGSNLVQLNVIYSNKVWMGMVSGGQSYLQTSGLPTDTLNPAHIKTTFGMGSISYTLKKGLNVSGGADIGFAAFGLSKYGLNGGLSYRMKRVPLSVRMFGRYSAYKLPGYSGTTRSDASTDVASSASLTSNSTEPMAWRRLVSGGIDLSWQLKMKLNK